MHRQYCKYFPFLFWTYKQTDGTSYRNSISEDIISRGRLKPSSLKKPSDFEDANNSSSSSARAQKATRAKANTEEIINAHVFLLKENLRKESLPLALIERKASSSRFLLARAGVSAQNFSGRRFFAHSPFFTLPLLASSVCRHFLLLPRNK